jgi:excisionase family DNA binding protein
MNIDDNALYTTYEVLKMLRISRSTLNRMIRRGWITGYKVSCTWRFYGRDIKSSLEASNTDAGGSGLRGAA